MRDAARGGARDGAAGLSAERERGVYPSGNGERMTEREKLERGMWYDAAHDGELCAARTAASELTFDFNGTRPGDTRRARELLERLLGHAGEDIEVLAPFSVDYGYNVSIGDRTFINHGAYLMDCAPIVIGSRVFIGPNFGAFTAQHPLVADERNRGLERALPITIGDDVWIGGNVTVLPGVSVGRGSVIGAGSLVTRDVPAGVVAMGSPCRAVRPITDADRIHPGAGV